MTYRVFAATAAAVLTTGLALAAAGCTSHSFAPGGSAGRSSASAAAPVEQAASVDAHTIATRMHLTHIVVFNAANDPNHLLGRQGGYTSDVDAGPTYTPSSTGSIGIEVYPDSASATARYKYLKSFDGTMFADGYDYLAGTAILRLDAHYTPAQATAMYNEFSTAQGSAAAAPAAAVSSAPATAARAQPADPRPVFLKTGAAYDETDGHAVDRDAYGDKFLCGVTGAADEQGDREQICVYTFATAQRQQADLTQPGSGDGEVTVKGNLWDVWVVPVTDHEGNFTFPVTPKEIALRVHGTVAG